MSFYMYCVCMMHVCMYDEKMYVCMMYVCMYIINVCMVYVCMNACMCVLCYSIDVTNMLPYPSYYVTNTLPPRTLPNVTNNVTTMVRRYQSLSPPLSLYIYIYYIYIYYIDYNIALAYPLWGAWAWAIKYY